VKSDKTTAVIDTETGFVILRVGSLCPLSKLRSRQWPVQLTQEGAMA